MQPYILGIDIGTGSTKAIAVDYEGKVLGSSQQYYSTLIPQPGYSEQDPETIFDAFKESIQKTVAQTKGQPVALCLSSAMHSLVAVDREGRPLTNLILWSDARSSAIADRIKTSPQGKSIYEATGTPIHSMSPLCKIIWLRENRPEVFLNAYKFISIKEYIWHQLFHEFEIDHSLASATGLFHIERRNWNEESLTLAGITPQQLSQPVATSFIRKGLQPGAAAWLSLPATTPVCIGSSDGCLANLGTYSLDQQTAAITIGTSGAVRVARPTPLKDYSIMCFNYLLDETTFICGGPINNGGIVAQWLLKNFLLGKEIKEEAYDELFSQIEAVPAGADGLIFLPYIYGERAPLWDEESCGVFFGIKPHHTQTHFLRAALEGVCFALQDILASIEDVSQPVLQVNASGGFVQSAVWVQLLADVTGKKICIHQHEDASAIGAAWLGLKSLQIIPAYSSIKQETGHSVLPRRERVEAYKRNFALFKTLYPSLKTTMHQFYRSGLK